MQEEREKVHVLLAGLHSKSSQQPGQVRSQELQLGLPCV